MIFLYHAICIALTANHFKPFPGAYNENARGRMNHKPHLIYLNRMLLMLEVKFKTEQTVSLFFLGTEWNTDDTRRLFCAKGTGMVQCQEPSRVKKAKQQ